MSDKSNVSGDFTATQNGVKLFETDLITIERDLTHITIEGSQKLGFPEGQAINLSINASTPDGKHDFKEGGKLLEVFYLNEHGTQYAAEGTFTSELDHTRRKYRITFDLLFHGHIHPINVKLDVSE